MISIQNAKISCENCFEQQIFVLLEDLNDHKVLISKISSKYLSEGAIADVLNVAIQDEGGGSDNDLLNFQNFVEHHDFGAKF